MNGMKRAYQELIKPTVAGTVRPHPIDVMAQDFQDKCGYSKKEAYAAAKNAYNASVDLDEIVIHA